MYIGGLKNDKGFLQNQKIKKKKKMVSLFFFDILQLLTVPHTVISNS